MLEVVGIVLFAALIAASIALHELGHLVPAKKFGVRVSDYMVGFGPTLWSTVRGETRYGVKWIPLGGYIRMIGMLPPDPADPEGRSRSLSTGRFAALIAQARAASFDEIRPGDENRLFYKLPVHRRVIIMLGGPFMNLVLAFVLFAYCSRRNWLTSTLAECWCGRTLHSQLGATDRSAFAVRGLSVRHRADSCCHRRTRSRGRHSRSEQHSRAGLDAGE